jgi:cytosine/adenosine deaminase-related metal-dependent hydrolase
MPNSLRARVIFPVDQPPILDGIVTIDADRIVALGPHYAESNAIDLGDVALLPGLVNAHTHLEFSNLRRPIGQPGIDIVDWIRLIIAERARDDKTQIAPNLLGQQESLAAGVTTVGDIVTNPTAACGATIDAIFFHEVIGFSRARAESSLNALVQRLEFAFTANASADFPAIQGISPHAPYTVSPLLLRPLITLAHRQDMPVAMHLAESREELQFLQDSAGPFKDLLEERSMWDDEAIPRGSTPHDYLLMLADAPRALVIHGNYLEDDELDFLATHRDRMSLIYCPRTHAYFKHAHYPLAAALAHGVRVALGTDSRASNPDLDLFAELQYVARTHPNVNPHDILSMGALAGAEALGREGDVGSITPGKLANLVAFPLVGGPYGSPDEMLAALLSNEHAPTSVWFHGRRTIGNDSPSHL